MKEPGTRMSRVHLVDVEGDLLASVQRVFEPFGGGRRLLKESGEVFIKINAVDFKEHCFTPPDLVGALITYMYAEGARQVYVIENCTQGNFTRLVFHVTGLARAVERAGAKVVYLDEVREEVLSFSASNLACKAGQNGYDQTDLAFPKLVVDKLVRNRDLHTYINVPKFKTHCMTTVTLGIKNQWGFVAQRDRIADHNYNLHAKFADILSLLKPDFTLVDARQAVQHGHYPARALLKKMLVPYGLLVGGDDVVSVDSVCCGLMGFPWEQVAHVRLAHEAGLGQAELDQIEILGRIDAHRQDLSCDLLPVFPRDVDVCRGEELCCREGCGSNVMACLQVFHTDFGGKGGFSVVMGKGHDRSRLEKLQKKVLVVGKCSVNEVGDLLLRSYGSEDVFLSDGCNNLTQTIAHLLRLMKISPLKIVPLSPFRTLGLFLQAKAKGSRALTPPLVVR